MRTSIRPPIPGATYALAQLVKQQRAGKPQMHADHCYTCREKVKYDFWNWLRKTTQWSARP